MKKNPQQLIEEISDFLVIYLKSGKVGLNSFISKTDLKISQLEQLLSLHFLLKDDVKQFVQDLPVLIRRLKTSTILKEETSHGKVRGEIQWSRTIKERLRRNMRDRTIFSFVERNREYAIKENLVLLEVLQVLYDILFEKIDSEYYQKYQWFKEWESLKDIVYHMMHRNVYLSHIQKNQDKVTERMIVDTMKHRNPLYQRAAEILSLYRQIVSGTLDESEVRNLLAETFIFPQEPDVLFELYWIVKMIRTNAADVELQLLDGKNRNNLVAEWVDKVNVYKIYHDSTGSGRIKFRIDSDEVASDFHPYIHRRLQSSAEAERNARRFFGLGFDTKIYWSGRPDIILEVVDRKSDKLKKVVIGEVKYTNRVEYAITGLRELTDYMKLVRDESGNYLAESADVAVEGILFTDAVPALEKAVGNLIVDPDGGHGNVRVVTF